MPPEIFRIDATMRASAGGVAAGFNSML